MLEHHRGIGLIPNRPPHTLEKKTDLKTPSRVAESNNCSCVGRATIRRLALTAQARDVLFPPGRIPPGSPFHPRLPRSFGADDCWRSALQAIEPKISSIMPGYCLAGPATLQVSKVEQARREKPEATTND